jgi:hypothetical protein
LEPGLIQILSTPPSTAAATIQFLKSRVSE